MRARRYKPDDTAARATLLIDEGTATGTAPLGEGSWHLASHQQSSVGAAQREAFSLTVALGLPIRCKSWLM